jgi:hypothetical protein
VPVVNKPRLFWAGVCFASIALILALNAQGAEPLLGKGAALAARLVAAAALASLLGFVTARATPQPVRPRRVRPTPRAANPPAPAASVTDVPSVAPVAGRPSSELRERWERYFVFGLAAVTLALGLVFGSSVAAGADSYGYVSEADLWVSGQLKVSQPWVRDIPWPNASNTFTPLGYTPFTAGEPGSIVPTYSPGLPLLMAAMKLVAGHTAMFFVSALSAACLVLATYGIGCRLGAPRAGAIGALLVASSPAVLFMMQCVMSDVPVAAAWSIAFYCLLGRSRVSALGAGLAAAAALLIRPNLAAGAVFFGLKYLLDLLRSARPLRVERLLRGALFVLGVAPGIIAVGCINRALYGSPFTSGYGSLQGYFATAHIIPNLKSYATWFADSQTPLAFLGLLAVLVPLRRLWPGAVDRTAFVAIVPFVISVIALYAYYLEFDTWWYLRFLLPIWPFIMVGVGAFALAVAARGKWAQRVTSLAVVALGVAGYAQGTERGAFELWRGEGRYVSAGRLTQRHTEPGSVVLAMQHSGSLRYYAGRVTLRYDWLDHAWLDRAVTFLTARGVHPYLLIEEWELAPFRERFMGQNTLEHVKEPILSYEEGGHILLFDLARAHEGAPLVVQHDPEPVRWVKPQPLPPLTWTGHSS